MATVGDKGSRLQILGILRYHKLRFLNVTCKFIQLNQFNTLISLSVYIDLIDKFVDLNPSNLNEYLYESIKLIELSKRMNS